MKVTIKSLNTNDPIHVSNHRTRDKGQALARALRKLHGKPTRFTVDHALSRGDTWYATTGSILTSHVQLKVIFEA